MKKRHIQTIFMALTAAAVFFTGCETGSSNGGNSNGGNSNGGNSNGGNSNGGNSTDEPGSPNSEDSKTYILFQNTSAYAVDVYSDSSRSTKTTSVSAGGKSSLEWTASRSGVTFYLSYQIPIGDDMVIPYNHPTPISSIRIDEGKITPISIASPVSSSTLLTNRVYLLLRNESSTEGFHLQQQGGTVIKPEKIYSGSGSISSDTTLVNPSERAWYIVNPSPTTYRVYANSVQKSFPGSDTGFQEGWFYTFRYTNGSLSLDTMRQLSLEVLLSSAFTVTFDADGGSPATQTKTVSSGASVGAANMPDNPTKSGYAFGGWYTAMNGGGTLFTATTTVSGNSTVYAKWVPQYTVTFDADGGSPATQTKTVNSGASSSTITNITYGYVSGGTWTLQSDERYKSPAIGHWGETKARVSFTSTAANASISIQLDVSSESGYDFAFISTLDNASATYQSGYYTGSLISGAQSVTVTIPVPTAGSHFIDIGYRKDGSGVGGSDCAWFKVTTPSSHASVGAANMPDEPTKSGYAFDGWYTQQNGGGSTFTAATAVTGNRTVYAKWLPLASVSGQISLQPTEDDPPLSNATLFVNESMEFSAGSGYSSYTWYWDGEMISGATSSVYTLAANSKTPGIYELSVFVSTSAGKMLSARRRVTIKAN